VGKVACKKTLISVRINEKDAQEIDAIVAHDEDLNVSDVVRDIIAKHFQKIRDMRQLNSME
jgi:Arc/MetJ-type ribon-helix-helix transcriptional regulator